jgi:serine/threonine protein kinase
MKLQSNSIIQKRYKIINHLGSGGFGETYLCEDLHNNNQYAIKLLQDIDSDMISRFEQEAQTLKKLSDECEKIPKFFDFFEDNNEYYIVQDYINGRCISGEIFYWNEEDVINFLQEILEILEFVHEKGIIHRDIKPSNIMRRDDGKLFLIDFGIVKQVSHSGAVSTTVPWGTPGYIPSEQERGHPKFCSDIYAIGIIAIESLTRSFNWLDSWPTDPNTLELIWLDKAITINSKLIKILNKMVRYNHLSRYQSATEVLQDLRKLIQPPIPFQIGEKWGYKNNEGKVIIDPCYDFADKFSEGLARFKINGKWGYIDDDGNTVIPAEYSGAGNFSEGLANVQITEITKTGWLGLSTNVVKKWGYIDQDGAWKIEPSLNYARPFKNGKAKISSDSEKYIDKNGNYFFGSY